MPPVDWDHLMGADAEDLSQEDSDTFFQQLQKFDPKDVDDVGKLQQLFLVAREVMNGLQEQVDGAVLIIEEETKSFNKKVQALKGEIEKLNTEMKDLEDSLSQEEPDEILINAEADTTELVSQEASAIGYNSDEEVTAPRSCNHIKRLKQKLEEKEMDVLIVLELISKCISEDRSAVKNKEKDECDIFGEYVSSSTRKLSDRKKALVKHSIQGIIFEAKMGSLEAAPPTVEPPTTASRPQTYVFK